MATPTQGGYWEAHCDRLVKTLGFKSIGECGEWRSCYFHEETGLYLCIYIDDFKMAGPQQHLADMWDKLGKLITLTPAEPVRQYLGCHHRTWPEKDKDGNEIRVLRYDMSDFLHSCCNRYEELAGGPVQWQPGSTPFLDNDDEVAARSLPIATGDGLQCPFCDGIYPEDCFFKVSAWGHKQA